MLRYACRRLNKAIAAIPIEASRFESEAVAVLETVLEALESSSADSVNNLNEGVLKVEFDKGTFILNKHAVTQQIWYSSPIIGPAYFDALNSAGSRWWSLKLQTDVYTQFKRDVQAITEGSVELDLSTR
jgi:frataxin